MATTINHSRDHSESCEVALRWILRRAARVLLGTALTSLIALCAGCNVIGMAATMAGDVRKHAAIYELPKRATVVIAERYDNPAEAAFDAEPIAHFVSDELRKANVVPVVIEPDKVNALRRKLGTGFQSMSIAAIGRAVGAEQVIYINIVQCGIDRSPGTDMMRGSGEVLVKVIDSADGHTLFPTDLEAGFSVAGTTETARPDKPGYDEASVRAALQRDLAAQVVRLFCPTPAG